MGRFSTDDPHETCRANDAALAEMKVLGEILELDYEKYITVMEYDND
jgi:hypothetical protein